MRNPSRLDRCLGAIAILTLIGCGDEVVTTDAGAGDAAGDAAVAADDRSTVHDAVPGDVAASDVAASDVATDVAVVDRGVEVDSDAPDASSPGVDAVAPVDAPGGVDVTAPTDVPTVADAGRDAGVDQPSVPIDAPRDGGVGVDVGADAGVDARVDAGSTIDARADAGIIVDARVDAGSDVGADSGVAADRGNPCSGAGPTLRVLTPAANEVIETCTESGVAVFYNFSVEVAGGAVPVAVNFGWRTPEGALAPPAPPTINAAPYGFRRQVGGPMSDVPPLGVFGLRGTWQFEASARDACGRTVQLQQPFALTFTNRRCPNP